MTVLNDGSLAEFTGGSWLAVNAKINLYGNADKN